VFQANTTKTYPAETGMIKPGVAVIKGGMTDIFLVSDGTDTVIIDTGDNPGLIKAGLREMKIDSSKINAVFLTHSDYDHTAGANLFTHSTFYMAAAEEAMLNGKIPRMFGFVRNHFNHPYTRLDDGETIHIGKINVKAVATPGHTYGSMSYIINGQYLFTGDLIALQDGKAKLFRWFNYSDALGRKSITKVSQLRGITLLCTGHNGITNDFKTAMQGW
jgi:glyoxylase-like metal-dependent hydrolase (beta-lactamase superfamily II)